MSKGDIFESDLLKLIFNGTPIANIADNAVSGPLTNLYVSLHASPGAGEAGDQTLNEVSYTGYARVAVLRNTSGWAVAGTNPTKVTPVAAITFGQCSGGTATVSNWAVGTLASGAGKVLYEGTVSPTISVTSGVTPQLTVASYVSEE